MKRVRRISDWVLASVDYDSGEICTHSQSCIWICGFSKLADALISGSKIHNQLGAQMLGVSYEEFNANAKQRLNKLVRQAAKILNFAMPGGGGSVTTVQQQRMQGPDTECANGPHLVKNDNGDLVPGYHGFRFCIATSGASYCGGDKIIRVYKGKEISPTCAECIECMVRLKKVWLNTWSENEIYFQFIEHVEQYGQTVDAKMLDRWPWLKEIYHVGQQMGVGEVVQHFDGRVRGGAGYCAIANTYFQALLGTAAKRAMRKLTRECYDRTLKVPSMLYENSRKSVFAGVQSPLFGSHMVCFQHDELLPEIPRSMGHEGALRTSEVMEAELMMICPDIASAIKAPPSLMTRWNKAAEPVWHGGRLAIWTPEHDSKTCTECDHG